MPDVIIRIVLTLKMAKDIVAYASQNNRETPIQDVTGDGKFGCGRFRVTTVVADHQRFLKVFTVRTWSGQIHSHRSAGEVVPCDRIARTRQGVIHADVQLACRAMVNSAVEDFVSPLLLQLLNEQKSIRLVDAEENRSLAAYFLQVMDENRLFEVFDAQVHREAEKEEVITVAMVKKRCLKLGWEEETYDERSSIGISGDESIDWAVFYAAKF
ncbi:hypothetical protein CUMW_231440 [Citrus unshiu]|uniref:Uncharacterized protein n=1 Tax=Citrus unshiu TaxID=55188 RepID=A0A2H5QHQ0_CITUN|nr:hypothetical protein CUMW_231440 [Citrus unshiu]